ncbi:MAG: hypothetical protein QRY72_05820 [Candidatus Rhabdochlamydia sp.]
MEINISNQTPSLSSNAKNTPSDHESPPQIHLTQEQDSSSSPLKQEALITDLTAQQMLKSKRVLHQGAEEKEALQSQSSKTISPSLKKQAPFLGPQKINRKKFISPVKPLALHSVTTTSPHNLTKDTPKITEPSLEDATSFSSHVQESHQELKSTLHSQKKQTVAPSSQQIRRKKFIVPVQSPPLQATTSTYSFPKSSLETVSASLNEEKNEEDLTHTPPFKITDHTSTHLNSVPSRLDLKTLLTPHSQKKQTGTAFYPSIKGKKFVNPAKPPPSSTTTDKVKKETLSVFPSLATQTPLHLKTQKRDQDQIPMPPSHVSKQPPIKEAHSQSPFSLIEVITHFENLLSCSIKPTVAQEEIASLIFKSLQTYIENKILTEDFIQKADSYLFHSELACFSQECLDADQSFIKPHAVQVIHSLADCLRALPQDDAFSTIVRKGTVYYETNIYSLISEDCNSYSISGILQEKKDDLELVQLIQHAPLYSTTQWLGTHNRNPAFILRSKAFKPQWVFKPANLKDHRDLSKIRDCEHHAFKINFHKKFPIPAVFLIQLRGVSGTIQPFIPETISFDAIPADKQQLLLLPLKKLLIFDLLFINHDRNMSNILYRKENDSYTCYGIDHEDCFQYKVGAYTMDQIDLIEELSPELHVEDLREAIQEVCSEADCEKYQKRLEACFKSPHRLDPDDILTLEQTQLLARIKTIGMKLRAPDQEFYEMITLIQKEMSVSQFTENKPPSQSDPSYLPD